VVGGKRDLIMSGGPIMSDYMITFGGVSEQVQVFKP